jgi:ABC-type multidrug transport system fused ATPase/permease subunit
MTHCNDTKLGLIEDRSKVNYMILSKIKEAKISGHQDLLIEKNNDYFREECHDHQIFYRLSTLYDIILLVLPTIVIVTIALYDLNEADHINVQQVYVLLSLLGICYNPMKAFRTLTISMHDGTWSLNKIQDYLYSPNE